MRLLIVTGLLLVGAGCALPRSAVLGETAMAMGPGGAEVGVSPGIAYQVDNSSPVPQTGSPQQYTTTRTLALPAFEGNAQYGFSDTFGLSLHLSPAGIQPGLKWTFLSGPLSLALQPALAFGFGSVGSTNVTQQANGNQSSSDQNATYYFSFLAGMKLLASHEIGIYGGIGYDLQALSQSSVTPAGVNAGSSSQVSNNLSVAVGWAFRFGHFELRPEVALMFLPGNTNSFTAAGATNGNSLGGGTGFLFYPNVTLAAVSSAVGPAHREPEPMKPQELSWPPLIPAP